VFATSGRARIAYEISGASGGSDVLLIHAGVNDRRSWRHVAERLVPRHRCIAFDARGYGETEYEPQDGGSPVADALAVLDAAGAREVVVVACSVGGQTAIDLTLAHPGRIAGLVLIGAAVRGAPYPDATGHAAEMEEAMMAAEEAGDLDEVGRLDAWMWLDGPEAPEGRVGGAARESLLVMKARALRAEDPGEQAETPEAWPRLGEIGVPALVLVGDLDVAEIATIGEQAAALIPGARYVLLEGVAHVPHLEGDETTLAQIAAFVDGLAG
jgi:pimeloyl-ACP methyl ester carboxylesterase